MKYYINYHTGAGNEWVSGTLENAQREADAGAAYTQQNISIQDENGEVVCCRYWNGVEYDPDTTEDTPDEIISFSSFGHYAAWQDVD